MKIKRLFTFLFMVAFCLPLSACGIIAGSTNKSSNKSAIDDESIPEGTLAAAYTESGFNGTEQELTFGENTYLYETVYSLKILKGYRVKLYRNDGGIIVFNADEKNLTESGWGTDIESYVIEQDTEETDEVVLNYNYIVGTQTFSPSYNFTSENAVLESARRMAQMGSNVLKCWESDIYTILEEIPTYKYIYMWYRSDNINWHDGLSVEEAAEEYDYLYNLTKKLLINYNNTGKNFYIGHWEGDWYLLGSSRDTNIQALDTVLVKGMADWYNIRQKAIDDAKKEIKHKNVNVWGYAEANRVTDAYKFGFDRIVNSVLPCINIDYLSYSSYDIQDNSQKDLNNYIDYMKEMLPVKVGVPEPRIFIGETGHPARATKTQDEHNSVNINSIAGFLKTNVKQILYWEMYNNEVTGIDQVGYWLIDDKNQKWKLYYSIQALLYNAKEYVRDYYSQNGIAPPVDEYSEWAADFLLSMS